MNCKFYRQDTGPRLDLKRFPRGSEIGKRHARALIFAACYCFILGPPMFAGDQRLAPLSNTLSNAAPNVSRNAGTISKDSTNAPALAATNTMDALDDKYRLAIGDRLSFRIVEDNDDPKELFVTDSGDLEVPYIGRVPAVGQTCKELAKAIKADLDKDYYYNSTVIVAVDIRTKSRGNIYLVGPVRSPGPQEIPSDEILTLSKAILRAGGFGDFADKSAVRVTRKGTNGVDHTFTVDVGKVLEKGQTESDLKLEPGDLIYIPDRLIRF